MGVNQDAHWNCVGKSQSAPLPPPPPPPPPSQYETLLWGIPEYPLPLLPRAVQVHHLSTDFFSSLRSWNEDCGQWRLEFYAAAIMYSLSFVVLCIWNFMVAEIKIMKIALSNQEFGCFGAGGIWYSSWFMNTGVEIYASHYAWIVGLWLHWVISRDIL